jgi:hypothetical protein
MSMSNVMPRTRFSRSSSTPRVGELCGQRRVDPQTSIAVSLHTADPGDAGDMSTSEIVLHQLRAASVLRTSGGWTVASGSVSPVANIDFTPGTGGSGTATHFGYRQDRRRRGGGACHRHGHSEHRHGQRRHSATDYRDRDHDRLSPCRFAPLLEAGWTLTGLCARMGQGCTTSEAAAEPTGTSRSPCTTSERSARRIGSSSAPTRTLAGRARIPSMLPDELKPRAERMYPMIVSGVGIAVKAKNPLFQPVADEVRKAMEIAVREADADQRLTDVPFVRQRMRMRRGAHVQRAD